MQFNIWLATYCFELASWLSDLMSVFFQHSSLNKHIQTWNLFIHLCFQQTLVEKILVPLLFFLKALIIDILPYLLIAATSESGHR